MNNDLLTAIIIVGGFFVFIFGVFAEGFIREWLAEERMKRSDKGEWTFAERNV